MPQNPPAANHAICNLGCFNVAVLDINGAPYLFSNIWWATSIALNPSTIVTGYWCCIDDASLKVQVPSFIAFTSGISGLAIAIVFLPLFVSMSNVKTFLSPGVFSFIISGFFSKSQFLWHLFWNRRILRIFLHGNTAAGRVGHTTVVKLNALRWQYPAYHSLPPHHWRLYNLHCFYRA